MHEQTDCGAQMPQNWSYGWEVPLTEGKDLFFQAEESTRAIQTQVGLLLFFFFFFQRSAGTSLGREGYWKKGHCCDMGNKSFECIHMLHI